MKCEFKITFVGAMLLMFAASVSWAADICMPLINNNVTVDGIVVGRDIGGAAAAPPSCPAAASKGDIGWAGVLNQGFPLVYGIAGTKLATLFMDSRQDGGSNKINLGVHIESTPDFTTNDRLTIYFHADATKTDWDPPNDFSLVFDGIGPGAATPPGDGCTDPGNQPRYYKRNNGNTTWVPQGSVPAGITFKTSYDYETVHDPETQLWELEIGLDVSSLDITIGPQVGVGGKLYLYEAGVAATTAYHFPATLTPVTDSGNDFLPNQGGVTAGTLQKVTVGNCTFDVVISSIKGTSNTNKVGQFTQLTPADFNGQVPLKKNHFTADIKFVDPANLAVGTVAAPNIGNVLFNVMPWTSTRACLQSSSDAAFRKSRIEEWRGSMVSLQTRPSGFTGDFNMATISQSFTTLGQTLTIRQFDWPQTKAQWDATGGKLNSTTGHACFKVDLSGFTVDLPNGNEMQQNLTYTSLSTIQESFLVTAPPKKPKAEHHKAYGYKGHWWHDENRWGHHKDDSIEYILRTHWDNLPPQYLKGSHPFRFRFTNARSLGLHELGRGYYSMRLKPGQEKLVEFEITGGVMPYPSKQYKLSAKAGGALLESAGGEPPLEIPVKPGSAMSILANGRVSVRQDVVLNCHNIVGTFGVQV
jgi:hypothetical protein